MGRRAANPAHQGLSAKILLFLREHEGEPKSVAEITSAMGLDPSVYKNRQTVTNRISMGRSRTTKMWSPVQRVAQGTYVYGYKDTGPWTEISRDGDVAVLRGPDGKLYAARPLSAMS